MKAKLTIFAIFILLGGYIAAQSNVQITDILVSPILEVDTITNLPVESDVEQLAILCKINDVTTAQTVQILVGTTEGSGNILSISANIVNDTEGSFLVYNDESFEIADNIITANIELSLLQTEMYNFITLFVIDENEEESNHLTFTK